MGAIKHRDNLDTKYSLPFSLAITLTLDLVLFSHSWLAPSPYSVWIWISASSHKTWFLLLHSLYVPLKLFWLVMAGIHSDWQINMPYHLINILISIVYKHMHIHKYYVFMEEGRDVEGNKDKIIRGKENQTRASGGNCNCHRPHKYTVYVYTSNAPPRNFLQPSARNNFLILVYT